MAIRAILCMAICGLLAILGMAIGGLLWLHQVREEVGGEDEHRRDDHGGDQVRRILLDN